MSYTRNTSAATVPRLTEAVSLASACHVIDDWRGRAQWAQRERRWSTQWEKNVVVGKNKLESA